MYKLTETLASTLVLIGRSGDVYCSENIVTSNGKVLFDNSCRNAHIFNDTILVEVDENDKKIIENDKIIDVDTTDLDDYCTLVGDYIVNRTFSSDFSTAYLGVFSWKENNYLWKHEYFFDKMFAIQNYIFASKESFIHVFDLITGEIIWEYNFSKYGKFVDWKGDERSYVLEKLIGIWEKKALVSASNGRLLLLNATNGELEYEWQIHRGNAAELSNPYRILESNVFILLNEEDKLATASNLFYYEIDLLTKLTKIVDLREELAAYNIVNINNTYDNACTKEYIFLTGLVTEYGVDKISSYDCLFALNRTTYKIDWFYSIKDKGLGTNVPKLGKNKLFINTTSMDLLVFEKLINPHQLLGSSRVTTINKASGRIRYNRRKLKRKPVSMMLAFCILGRKEPAIIMSN